MEPSVIRRETPGDAAAVREVDETAFETGTEADLVARPRENGRVVLSLVAERKARGSGTFCSARSPWNRMPPRDRVVGLAPLAVRPGWHRKGLGSALMRGGLEDCRELGYGSAVVVGHSAFSAGSGSSRRAGSASVAIPDEAFMARPLGEEPPPPRLAAINREFAQA